MHKNILKSFLASVTVLLLVACGETTEQIKSGDILVSDEVAVVEETKTVEENEVQKVQGNEEVSIDFEDGNMGFVKLYTRAANADASEVSVVDYQGSKALYVKNMDGKTPYVAFDISGLLGADVEKVATIEMSIGTEYNNGNFSAVSGYIISWAGKDLTEYKDVWSVYIANKNPKKAIAEIATGEEYVAEAGNIIIVTLDTDNGLTEGNGNANLYIDNIRFLDAQGNVLKADSGAVFTEPNGFGNAQKDMSNLTELNNAVEFAGFNVKEAGWAQNGLDMPQEIIEALVPGAIVEIEYKSDNGDIWIVMPDALVGWTRVGDGTNGKAAINDSCSIAQITYEQIAEFCGEDKSTWGNRMQAEASGAWEVFTVKVGQSAME